jgi:hypothetical protein
MPEKKAKVIFIDRPTSLSLPPDRILEAALGTLDKVLIIGEDKDGDPYYATSVGDQDGGYAEVNLMVDKFKRTMLDEFV